MPLMESGDAVVLRTSAGDWLLLAVRCRDFNYEGDIVLPTGQINLHRESTESGWMVEGYSIHGKEVAALDCSLAGHAKNLEELLKSSLGRELDPSWVPSLLPPKELNCVTGIVRSRLPDMLDYVVVSEEPVGPISERNPGVDEVYRLISACSSMGVDVAPLGESRVCSVVNTEVPWVPARYWSRAEFDAILFAL